MNENTYINSSNIHSFIETQLPARSSLLIEEATYSGSLSHLEPQGIHLVAVKVDAHGLDPDHLQTILDGWAGLIVWM
jgi:DNA-binding transcriptional MocR family regulator